jgi:hypothetical protein
LPTNPFTPGLDPITGLPKKKTTQQDNQTQFGNNVFGPQTGPGAGINYLSGSVGPSVNFPGTASVPGFTPDYAALINADPLLGQTRADFAANGVTDAASRNAAINRALVQFGAIPDMAKAQDALGLNLGDLVDPNTRQLASQNQFSTQATLSDALQKQIRSIRQSLAARGGLRSGELGFQLGEANKQFGQAENDATQKLLDSLGGYQSAYVEGQRQAQAALRQAQQEAAARQAQLHPATGSQTAALAFVDANGNAVYQGGDGSLYNLDGTRYSGPGRAAAAPQAPAQQPNQGAAPDGGSVLDAILSPDASAARQRGQRGDYLGLLS